MIRHHGYHDNHSEGRKCKEFWLVAPVQDAYMSCASPHEAIFFSARQTS